MRYNLKSEQVILLRQDVITYLRSSLAAEPPPPGTFFDSPAALVSLAAFHRVAPLLARALPQPELAAYARSLLPRTLLLTGELARLLKDWQSQGIAAIPFKGPGLAVQLYGDPALRHFDDLDILVRPADFPAAKAHLLACGYQFREAHPFHETFSQSRSGIESVVEVHWDVMDEDFPVCFDLPGIWARRVPFTLGGASTFAFAPEDLLLLLCAHGSRHLWFRLQWVCDVAQLLRRFPALDWAVILECARQAGARRSLFLGLAVAHDLLGAPLPPEIEPTLRRDAHTAQLARRVREQILAGPLEIVKPWKETRFRLQLIDRLPERIAYAVRIWFHKSPTASKIQPS